MLREASEKSSDSMLLNNFSIKDLDENTIKSFLRYLEIHPDLQESKSKRGGQVV